MPDKVKCPECQHLVGTQKIPAGETFNCPYCQAMLRMPGTSAPDDVCHACNQRGIPGSPQGLRAADYSCRQCGAPVPAWMREDAIRKLGLKPAEERKEFERAEKAARAQAHHSAARTSPAPQQTGPSEQASADADENHCPSCRMALRAVDVLDKKSRYPHCARCKAVLPQKLIQQILSQEKSRKKAAAPLQQSIEEEDEEATTLPPGAAGAQLTQNIEEIINRIQETAATPTATPMQQMIEEVITKKSKKAKAPTPTKPKPSQSLTVSQSQQEVLSQLSMPHLSSEIYDAQTQRLVLRRLLEQLEQGMRDPELLYLGGRYAVALGLRREACRFLDELAAMLCDGDQIAPAYFPVGLLYLHVLPFDDKNRADILQRLQQLSASSPKLNNALRLAGYDPSNDVPEKSPHHLLLNIEHNRHGIGDEVLQLIRSDATSGNGDFSSIREIQQLARSAQENYGAGKLAETRAALEGILLLDGDQPDALRNLITVTSELQDIEAYERYWRRYIKVLLWRIMRGDDVRAALEDLVRFYSRVAIVTDREFGESSSKTSERLKTPGLLSRWLEAHAALVWLEAAAQPRVNPSANAAANGGAGGRFNYAPLMKFWYRVFYPEFSAYLDVDSQAAVAGESRQPLKRTSLTFDPALKLLTRFAEWAQFYFFIGDTYDAYAEILTALAGCVARLPIQPYVLDLKAKFETDELKPRPFRRSLQEACSGPLFLKRNMLRDAEDWPGLIEFLGDEEILDRLTPVNRLWLAYALCKAERQEEGLEVACQTLPEMLTEEFEKDTFTEGLFSAIVNLNMAKVLPNEGPVLEKEFASFVKRLKAVPRLEAAPEFISSVLESVLFEKAFRDTQTMIEQGDFAAAKKALRKLPETTDKARERKKEWLQQIEEIEERERNNKLIDQLLEQAKALVGEGRFAEAKQKVRQLPGKSVEMDEVRQSWLGEIEKLEERERTNKLIDGILAQAKKLVEQKRYTEAKKEVRRLPSTTEELKELRDDWLKQITEVEEQGKLDKQIDETIARAKELIAKDNFSAARALVKKLPDTNYTRELRNSLLKQIDDVEKQAQESERLRKQIDSTFDKVQAYISMGSYNDAVLSVYQLPDEPEEVEKIKDKWLADIKRLAPPGTSIPALSSRPRPRKTKGRANPFGLDEDVSPVRRRLAFLDEELASPALRMRSCSRCRAFDNPPGVSRCYKCGSPMSRF